MTNHIQSNYPRFNLSGHGRHALLLCAAILILPAALSAADKTWTGGGADALWNTPANWNAALVSGDTLFFGGSTRPANSNDLAADTPFAGITFQPAAAAFTLSGERITLNGNIVNQSPAAQTIGLPLYIDSADRAFDAANGPFVFTSSLNYSGAAARHYRKRGTNELVFTGATIITNANSRFTLEDGTLRFTPGSRFHLVNTGSERNMFVIGNVADKHSAMIIEKGADVALGGINMQTASQPTSTSTFDLLVDGGTLTLTGTDNSFGDQQGNRATVTVDNGGIITNLASAAFFNAGTRIPMTITINDGLVCLGRLSMGRTADTGDRQGGRSDIFINKGELHLKEYIYWMSTSWAGRTNTITLGDGRFGVAKLSTPLMQRGSTNGRAVLNLNGGILECRGTSSSFLSGLSAVNMLAGGVIIDTMTYALSISESIQRDPGLAPETRDGGITKLGSGTLNFIGPSIEFNGPLRVESGSLRFSAAMPLDPEEIFVAPGGTLSFRGSHQQNLRPQRLAIGDATTTSRLDLDVSADDFSCDTLHIPAGGSIGRINFHLMQRGGTEVNFAIPGEYALFTFETEPPDTTLWTHANLPARMISSFIVDRAGKTVSLRLEPASAHPATWSHHEGGNWATDAYWDPAPPADSTESHAYFWDAITAPATVTLNTATRIGGISFRNASSYTLAGAGTLTVGDAAGGGYLTSDAGNHTVTLPLSLPNPVRMGAPSGATLTLDSTVTGPGGIVKENAGTLRVTGANAFTGGTTLSAGTLEIPGTPDALGSGPVTFAGGNLAFTSGGSLSLPNALNVRAGGTLNPGTATLSHSGDLTYTANGTLIKDGTGELRISGTYTGTTADQRLNFRQGTVRLLPGAAVNLTGSSREILQTTYNVAGQTSTLIIETGAVLNTGGMRLMTGGSAGTSIVHVAGGQLNLLNTGATIINVGGGRSDILVDNGGTLRDTSATSTFNLGVNGLGTLAITNGTVSLTRFTVAGYEETVGTTARRGSADVTIGPGGLLEVRDYLTWITDSQNLTARIRLAGGRFITPAMARSTGSTGTATLILDGGTLDCLGLTSYTTPQAPAMTLANYLYGVNVFQLGAGDTVIDTRANAVTITQPLVMEPGTAAAAGLTKTGLGSLTLAGANAFNAPLTVAQGTLTLTAPPNNTLTVAGGATLATGAGTVTAATFEDGATLAITPGAPITVTGTLTLGATVNLRLGAYPVGTHTLFTSGTLTGNAAALRIANPEPSHTFSITRAGANITLTITANPNAASWAVDRNDTWGIGTNWDPNAAPNGPGHAARFDRAYAAPRTVTLASPVTLGALLFDSANAPTLSGAMLAFDNGDLPAVLAAAQGAPVIATALALTDATLADIAPAASLTVAGNATGTGPLTLTGGGSLALAATNAVSTTVRDGTTLTLAPDSAQQAPLTLDNGILAASVPSVLSVPLTAGPFGATLTAAPGETLTLTGTLTGEGSVTKAGSGTAALTGTLSHQGATAVQGGTLALAAPPPAALTLGAGTLAYTGPAENVPGYTVNTYSDRLATVLSHTADITVTGSVQAVSGGFVKRGTGTLAFTFPGAQTLSAATASPADVLFDARPDGDAPTQGFTPFTVSEGHVILGAPGQVNMVNGTLLVGHYTTDAADAETAAHLTINGGDTTLGGNIYIGRGNGNATTAPAPLQSTVTIEGGTVTLGGFSLGHNGGNTTGFNARPSLTITGGTVSAPRINIAEHTGSESTFTLTGGTVTLTDNIQVGHQTTFGGGGTATLAINGGSITVANDINLGVTASASGTLHLTDGTASARNIIVGSGQGRVLFDGGTLYLRNGPMSTPVELTVREGGARIGVATGRFTLARPLTTDVQNDGGLTKVGAGELGIDNPAAHTFTGPVTVEAGTLSLRGANAALPTTALTVCPGAMFQAATEEVATPRTVTVSALTLGSPAEPAGLSLWADVGDVCDSIAATSLTLGKVAVNLYQRGTLAPATYTGTYPIITYTGADPADITGLFSVANPSDTRDYAFTLDSANKRILLTVTAKAGTATGAAIWITDANDIWSVGANWDGGTAPTDTPEPARFANVLSQDTTVTVDTPATLGGLVFDADNRYTLAGTETITLAGQAPAITALRGSHTISTPLAVAGIANVSLAPGGNTLTLAAPVTGAAGSALTLAAAGVVELADTVEGAALTAAAGSIHLLDGAAVNSTVRSAGGVITATAGDSTLNGTVELTVGTRSIRANSGTTLTVNGPVIGGGTLFKDNSAGPLELTSPANTYSGGTRVNSGSVILRGGGVPGTGPVTLEGGILAAAGDTPVAFGNPVTVSANDSVVQADAPLTTSGTFTMPTPRTLRKRGTNVWTFAGSLDATGNVANRLRIDDGTLRFAPGSFFRLTGTGGADERQQIYAGDSTDKDLGILIEPGATVIADSLGVQWAAGNTGNRFTLTMNGGSLSLLGSQSLCFGDQSGCAISVAIHDGEMRQVPDAAWADIGTRSKVNWIVNGGTVSLGRAAFGRMNGAGSGRNNGGTTLTVNGGTFEARDFFSWMSTSDNNVTNTVTLNGGTFSVPATRRYHTGGRVILNLNGGILGLRGLPSSDTTLHGDLLNVLDGVNEINVFEGGAAFEAYPAADTMIITQPLVLAGGAGAPDGGLTKLGAGALKLDHDIAFTGAVKIVEGTLDAVFTSTPALTVNKGGTLDLTRASGTATFTDISGSGSAVNGTLALTGELSPGDAENEPGTFHAENLIFTSGTGLRLDWTPEANDRFEVSGNLTGTSGGHIDFGREPGAPIPVPLTAVIGTYGTCDSGFGSMKVRNAGYPAGRAFAANIKAENGTVTLSVMNSGMIMILK